jgi:hypothetical protein
MIHDDDEFGELPELSNREMLRMIMQEIADTNKELSGKIDGVERNLGKRIDALASDVHTLRGEVHRNHSTFIANQTALEKRVKVLEMAA